jgi:hypothetical protein
MASSFGEPIPDFSVSHSSQKLFFTWTTNAIAKFQSLLYCVARGVSSHAMPILTEGAWTTENPDILYSKS